MTVSKSIQIKAGTTSLPGRKLHLRLPYTNNNTGIKHQTVNKAYNIKQNINSKNKGRS